MTPDERRWWAVAVGLGVLAAALGALSEYRGRDLNPFVGHAMRRPRDFDGKRLWVPAAKAVAVDAVETQEIVVRVTNAELTPGTWVSISAVFRADGPYLEAEAVRVIEGGDTLPVYAVSIAVALAVVWLLSRYFSFSREPLISPRSPWPTC